MIIKDITKWERMAKEGFQESSTRLQEQVKAGNEKGYDFGEFSQDLFSSLYQSSPKVGEKTTRGTAWAKQAISTMQALPEYKKLRGLGTVGNTFHSGVGSIALAKALLNFLPTKETENPDKIKEKIEAIEEWLRDHPTHPKAEEFKGRNKKLQDALQESEEEWGQPTDEGDVRIAVRNALGQAYADVQELDGMASSFGFGTSPGQDGYQNAEVKLALAERIRNNQKLREIADLAGRFQAEAQTMQSHKKQPGPDELSDVELGSALGRVLPTEGLKVCDPVLEVDFFKRLTEEQLMQYKLETVEKKTRGPIIVCLDSSGSMSGPCEVWSKAIALAMCRIATDGHRTFEIIHFTHEVARKDVFAAGEVNSEDLIDSCAYFANGGTNFEPVLNEAFNDIEQAANNDLRNADVVFITDGIAPISADFAARIAQLKSQTGATLQTICLGSDSPELRSISDQYTQLTDLALDKDVKENLFSV